MVRTIGRVLIVIEMTALAGSWCTKIDPSGVAALAVNTPMRALKGVPGMNVACRGEGYLIVAGFALIELGVVERTLYSERRR